MDLDFWQTVAAEVIAGVILALMAIFIPFRDRSIYSYLKNRRPKNYFTDVKVYSEIDKEIPTGKLTNIEITFHGSLTDGFITCEIIDSDDKSNWSVDGTTIRNLDNGRQIGKETFQNEKHTYKWAIKPELERKKGKGRLEIGAYDTVDRNLVALEIVHVLLV